MLPSSCGLPHFFTFFGSLSLPACLVSSRDALLSLVIVVDFILKDYGQSASLGTLQEIPVRYKPLQNTNAFREIESCRKNICANEVQL
jgi:hypothetical protein